MTAMEQTKKDFMVVGIITLVFIFVFFVLGFISSLGTVEEIHGKAYLVESHCESTEWKYVSDTEDYVVCIHGKGKSILTPLSAKDAELVLFFGFDGVNPVERLAEIVVETYKKAFPDKDWADAKRLGIPH